MIKEYLKLGGRVWLVFLVCIFFSMGSAIIPFLVLLLNDEFHFSAFDTAVIFCIIMLLLIPASIIGGKIANNFNKKNAIVVLRLLYVVCLLLYMQTNAVVLKIILLIAALIFIGMSNPSLNSIILDMVTDEESRKAYAVVFMGQSIGRIVAPIVTGALLNEILVLFKIYSLSSLIAVFILVMFTQYRLDGIRQQKNGNKTKAYQNAVSEKKYIVFLVVLSFIGFEFCYAQQSFSLPIEMKNIFESMAVKYYGYIVSYNSVLVLILTPIIAVLVKKISPLKSVIISGVFCGFGFGMLYFSAFIKVGIVVLAAFWTIGEVLYCTNSFIVLSRMLNKYETGTASALILVSRSIGISLCSIFSSLIIQFKNISVVWEITFIISILSAVLLYLIMNRGDRNAYMEFYL